MKSLSATDVDERELDKLDAVVASLPAESSLGEALHTLSASVRRGVEVTIAASDSQISPAVAAKLLGMSRTHLYKLLDAGVLPCVNVGRDRRLSLSDVVDFQRGQHESRVELAERFAHATVARRSLIDSLAHDDRVNL